MVLHQPLPLLGPISHHPVPSSINFDISDSQLGLGGTIALPGLCNVYAGLNSDKEAFFLWQALHLARCFPLSSAPRRRCTDHLHIFPYCAVRRAFLSQVRVFPFEGYYMQSSL